MGEPQQCVDGWKALPLFHAHDHRVAETGARRDLVEREFLAQAFGLKQSNQAVDDGFALGSTGHPRFLRTRRLDKGYDYRHNAGRMNERPASEDYMGQRILRTIQVRRAVSDEEVAQAYAVRWRGYRKYFDDPGSVRDHLDAGENAVLLLASRGDGTPVGTLRILDRRRGPIELDAFLSVDGLLPAERHPVAEATRFAVPTCPDSRWIKLALWKAYFRYCSSEGLATMLICVRRSAVRDYENLLFENLGEAGAFSHPLLAAHRHETYAFDVPSGPERYRTAGHPLYAFFVEDEHPLISFA